jgi:hypothetical protein
MMKNLAYHEADAEVLEGALELYAAVYGWWLTAKLTTDAERELAHRNIASVNRLQAAMKEAGDADTDRPA